MHLCRVTESRGQVVEAFLMPNRIRAYNQAVGLEVVPKLKALRSGPGPEGVPALPAAAAPQPKSGALKTVALGAAGGAVAGVAVARAADVLEGAETAEDGIAVAAETAGEEGEGVASTLASLLGDE